MTVLAIVGGIWIIVRLYRVWFWFGPGSDERIKEQVRKGRMKP